MLYISLLVFLSISGCHGRHSESRSPWSSWRRQDFWGVQQLEYNNPTSKEERWQSTALWQIRGGDDTLTDATEKVDKTTTAESNEDTTINNHKKPQQTLDQRVRAALQKFGLGQPSPPPPPPLPPTAVEEETTSKEEVVLESNFSSDESHEQVISAESSASSTTSGTPTHDEAVPSEPAATLSAVAPATECEDGVCPVPDTAVTTSASTTTTPVASTSPVVEFTDSSNVLNDEDYYSMAQKIATDMGVHSSLSMAALIATRPDDDSHKASTKSEHLQAARTLIEQELERINQIKDDAPEVQQLVLEGYDAFLSRRALAFAEMNMDDARAILMADQLDEEEEQERLEEAKRQAAQDDAVTSLAEQPVTAVHTNFDPAQLPATSTAKAPVAPEPSMPKPAKKSDVVFEATAAEVQELVLESPVPVLLDVYADWCGPCKVLGPALEDMAVKAGGAFRLVKINSDKEGVISKALEVTALPTVFGIRDGQIVHMFQGIPRSDDFIKKFMMNLLVPGYSTFDPPISAQEKKKYAKSTSRLAKVAGAACWPFSARERLQDRVFAKLDALVKESGGMAQADDSAKLLRSLLSNVIRDPYNNKFRNVNLANKALEGKVSKFPSAVVILKTVGFSEESSTRLALKPQQKVINVAPLVVARDCIDKWIDKNRYEIAVAARKRKDDQDRAVLAEEAAKKAAAAAAAGEDAEDEDESEEDTLPPNSCTIKIRLEGKKKVQEVVLDGDEPLQAVLDALPKSAGFDNGTEFQLTCAAKRLIVKSSDETEMKKSLADHGLLPAASLVIKRMESTASSNRKVSTKSQLSQRAADKKSKKKGSHTMQSIGIYAKDDNNKAELIDGGGGVWYEHDVSDDEPESAEPAKDAGGDSSEEEKKQKKVVDQSEPEQETDDGDEASDTSEPDEGDAEADDEAS